jgi:hypothetical protein
MGAAMTKAYAVLMLLIAAGALAACVGSDRVGTGTVYVGRFDNDENRSPNLVDNAGRSAPQNLIYGDGEH